MDDYLKSNKLLPWFLEGLLEELLGDDAVDLPKDEANVELPKAARLEGFLTTNWFGPFLLGPRGQTARGHC
ncbi:MAG: hypothetical protein PHW74_04275 [Desulfobacca sp.]|nr:hypothetical protein [Desulfobacca sp.]